MGRIAIPHQKLTVFTDLALRSRFFAVIKKFNQANAATFAIYPAL